jgi:adenine-specific DNA-methyltransferase
MARINFKGKEIVRNYHLAVPYHELKPDEKKSFTKKVGLNDNLIIHGDNLLALKALLPTYARKVKCIYIDPPYNIGNEKWAYNDNVNSPMMKEWLGKVVDKDDLTRHDKWLCMMMPRLKLLRELLRDDGVIFVSIDDNEEQHLRMLMDEVFQGNFVGQLIWRKKEGGGQTDQYFVTEHEYILIYAKSQDFKWLDETIPESESKYNKEDENGKFSAVKLAKWGTGAHKEDRPKMYFPIKDPDGKNIYPVAPDGRDGRWRVGKERMQLLIDNNLIYWEKKNGKWVPYEKIYYEEGQTKVIKERSIIFDLATTGDASNELKDIFGRKDIFDNPKPHLLVQYLLTYTTDKNSIVLDSFAGSGTTARAVLALNKEDGGNRKFILVQLPEEVEKNKPAFKLGFRQVIDITAERVRRVIKGIKGAKDEKLRNGLGGSFSYFELGKPIDAERILKGDDLPSFVEMARYIFYTATGEEFNEKKVDKDTGFIGESKEYKVYLLYKPDLEYLKSTALTLDWAQKLGGKPASAKAMAGKKRLVFAPTKYLDHDHLERLGIEFAQLPFDIYQKT